MKRKLDILIPQYNEDESIVKPLLDSIAIQQNISFDEIGVIICNDGSGINLTKEFLNSYPFTVEYYKCEHRGVSSTRNSCLDHSQADYVMFCDADDMFFNICGLYLIFREINKEKFDTLISYFMEESRDKSGKPIYMTHNSIDGTFVHGKVHNREFLINNNIRWNNDLTIHEDSYFNLLARVCADPNKTKLCETPFYLWKWRDDSVCRHDSKYILKTFNNLLDSNTALINEVLNRGKISPAEELATQTILDSYYTMNKKEWVDQENQEYRLNTEKRFKRYWLDFNYLYEAIPEEKKNAIIIGQKNKFFTEGMMLESITFDDWISHIETL